MTSHLRVFTLVKIPNMSERSPVPICNRMCQIIVIVTICFHDSVLSCCIHNEGLDLAQLQETTSAVMLVFWTPESWISHAAKNNSEQLIVQKRA